MNPNPDDAPVTPATMGHSAVRGGACDYGRALGRAGGHPVETLARGDGNAAVCVALYASPPYDLDVPALAVSRLSITLTAARVTGGLQGERRQRFDSPRHMLFLTPAGAETRWHKESPSRHLNIYFHPEALARPAPMFNTALPGARALIDELAAEMASPGDLAAEAADSLARLLLVRLARWQLKRPQPAHSLTPQRLARLDDYVRAHLDQRILVSDMAAVVGLSANHFAHAFAERTGQAPHRFVMSRRLERALQMLRQPGPGLACVAATCGFASQQHLSQVLRRHLGTTPARYRLAAASGTAMPEPPAEGVLAAR